jgi:C-terminal processing protease CtpA/Prc
MQQVNLMRHSRRVAIALLSTLILLLCSVIAPPLTTLGQVQPDVFEQVWNTVNDNFFDPNFNGVNWKAIHEKYKAQARRARSQPERARIVNQMLGELRTSHTRLYTPDEPGYYVESQSFHPIQSFAGKANHPLKLLIQRSSVPGSQMEITVTPKLFDGTIMFLDAMKASAQVIEQAGRKIGYVHLWSYAGEQFQKQLETELFFGRLKEVDSFVLDLREGWGGAAASYLNIYTPRNIRLTGTPRTRKNSTSSSAWSKPVVMLVNEESRSGKEILAYGFRKYGIGAIVGAKTAGAVVQGNLFAMNDGSVLYLAVVDVHLDGKQRLEGVGVMPNIEVPFSVEYTQGVDPQKERAISVAIEAVNRQ